MLLSVLYIIGIAAEAMTGAMSAGRRKMDWFGVMLVASATAIGGGTIRDILLGHYPLGWVENPQFLAITCIAGVLTTGIAKWIVKLKGLFIRLDALGHVRPAPVDVRSRVEHRRRRLRGARRPIWTPAPATVWIGVRTLFAEGATCEAMVVANGARPVTRSPLRRPRSRLLPFHQLAQLRVAEAAVA